MRADLEWFRTFKAIFDTGTMSDAAKELNISRTWRQSAFKFTGKLYRTSVI